jgi:hypothetical protein
MLVRCSYLRRSWVALKRADSGGCWAAVLFLDLFSYWDKLGHCWGWVGGQCFGRGAAIRYMSDLVETESNEDAIKWNDDNKKYPADSVAGKGTSWDVQGPHRKRGSEINEQYAYFNWEYSCAEEGPSGVRARPHVQVPEAHGRYWEAPWAAAVCQITWSKNQGSMVVQPLHCPC